MSVHLSVELRRQLEDVDDGQCVYCQTRVDVTGQALTTDHIIPTAAGGSTTFPNLCRACRSCNEAKGEQTRAIDPLTGETLPLYHPRQQQWADHFAWDNTGNRSRHHRCAGHEQCLDSLCPAALGERRLASASLTIELKFTAPTSPPVWTRRAFRLLAA